MRKLFLLGSSVAVVLAIHGCSSCHSEVQVTTAPPPPASSSAVVEAPPPPEPVAVRNASIEGTRIKIPHELEFAVSKATFDDTKDPNKEILGTLLEFLTKNTHVTKIRIEGHTDNTGKPDTNMTLSQQRADAVAKWLTDHGIAADRIKTQGFGDTKPEVANDTPEHKQQNRRTEFHVDEIDGKPRVPHHRQGAGGAVGPATSGSAAGSAAPPPAASGSAAKPH
jgi:outer membrane protein OmpA-like peptidoglycan-associated protein